jgi:hypothetical protein
MVPPLSAALLGRAGLLCYAPAAFLAVMAMDDTSI